MPIALKKIDSLKASDIAEHVRLRKEGMPKLGLNGISSSALQHELLHIRGVLSHANVMWDTNVDLNSFYKATTQLRKTRQILASKMRDTLLSSNDLLKLTKSFT